jgi:hypothetical protein
MRRALWLLPVAGLGALAGLVLLLRPATLPAGAGKGPDAGPLSSKSAALPISRVILYSSGVGYFQRSGKVQGNARVDLSFPASDINDLLKSLVLRDLGGGQVSAVSYDSHDPVEKTLQSFAINLNGNPSFAAILNQARGEKVEVVLQQSTTSQPGSLTGSVLGVEVQHQKVSKDAVADVEVLNLWCAEGVRGVRLAEVARLRFLSPVLEGEVRKALEALALGHDAQKKTVTLSFAGAGEREVRVGYVTESPVWKTSYRLVLSKEGRPYLQGWAIVENPSDEDWSDVGMALVSGRPISFRMDLYQPLYAPRPVVEPELFASLRPQTYEGDMDRKAGGGAANRPARAGLGGVPAPSDGAPGGGAVAPAAPEAAAGMDSRHGYALSLGRGEALRRELADPMKLQQGVQSVASASQLGDSFQYVLDQPVSLARQKSALLPIVNKEVGGQRVSIYNEQTHPKFPLLGLRFKNTSGLHLMQGPITVFEGSAYAGDSRVLDVQPNEERLLSYAIDLGTEVEAVPDNPRHTITKLKALKGSLYSTTREVEGKTFRVKNRSDQDRTLLIEHPFRPTFHLTSKDKPAERTRDVHRFEVKVPAGKTATERVTEETDVVTQLVLTNANDDSIRFFLRTEAASPAVKEALRKALELKGKADRSRQELAHAEQQLADIERDQQRIRANLKETPPTAAAYKKYLEKLDSQEAEVDRLRERIKQLRDDELAQRQDYERFLAGLDVE